MLRSALFTVAVASLATAAWSKPKPAERELIRLEHDYARALVRRDIPFLTRFYASDWYGGNFMGFATKTSLLNILKTGRYVIKSMEPRDLRVRIRGTIAIVQGVDEEVTSMHGRDTSGSWGFTDVFERRNGRWQCIASHTTKIERPRVND